MLLGNVHGSSNLYQKQIKKPSITDGGENL